jgi:hypothetical protein
VGEPVAVAGVDVGADRSIARNVNVDGTFARKLRDIVVQMDGVVDVQSLDEFAVARRRQSHDVDALALGEQVGGDDRRLR